MNLSPAFSLLTLSSAALLAGCRTAAPAYERTARHNIAAIDPVPPPAELPVLTAGSPPADFVRYAVLHQPSVAAAYYDWRAAVESITPARSLPDPRLTLQADIKDTLMSFMPGVMFDLVTTGRRAAMGREAAAGADVAYRTYVATVLDAAARLRRAWIELAFVEETRELHQQAADAIDRSLAATNADYATGSGQETLGPQIDLQNQAALQHAQRDAFDDRLVAARAAFKAALGLRASDDDPPWPRAVLAPAPLPDGQELWQRVLAANPDLARMRAMVEMTVAGVDVAHRTRTPDFSLGLMADLKASPVMLRPTASLGLPVWRDKIAATIAAAEARHHAAAARVTAEEIDLAAAFARQLYLVRESDRMLAYLDRTALPNLDRAAAAAEAGYESDQGRAATISGTRVQELELRIERAGILRQREFAAVDLQLMTAGIAPSGSPLLPASSTQP